MSATNWLPAAHIKRMSPTVSIEPGSSREESFVNAIKVARVEFGGLTMRLRNKVAVIIFALLVALAIFGTASWSRKIQESDVRLSSNDKTKALKVEKVEQLPQAVKVSLRNVSGKTIDGIQLSINGGGLQIDFVTAEEEDYQRLLPGAVYEQFLSPGALAQPLEVSVLAVTFDDKTSDGDPALAQEIIDTRRGCNKQLKRIRPLLEAALNSSDGDVLRVLDKLKSRIESLPDEESTESFSVRGGEHQAKAEVLERIEFLRQRQIATGALPIRLALTKMKNRRDKQIQKGPE